MTKRPLAVASDQTTLKLRGKTSDQLHFAFLLSRLPTVFRPLIEFSLFWPGLPCDTTLAPIAEMRHFRQRNTELVYTREVEQYNQ
jgi:hypothetical protein